MQVNVRGRVYDVGGADSETLIAIYVIIAVVVIISIIINNYKDKE